jgi:HEAT repeat protein
VADPEADRLLAQGLADPSSSVRRSALDALLDRSPEDASTRALISLLQSERSPGVRGQAVNLAARWLTRAPLLVAPLEQIAAGDSVQSLRATARRALAAR